MTNINAIERDKIIEIRAYENAVDMPESQRVTYLDSNSRAHLKAGDNKISEFDLYAEKCSDWNRFGREVDDATSGVYAPHDHLKICDTPDILQAVGLKPLAMLYTQRHLHDALQPKEAEDPHKHGFSVKDIKRLPELLESPAILADNPSRDDALLMVLGAVDSDKLPVIASVKPDGRGNYELSEMQANIILTVFGKNDFSKYFETVLTPSRIIYIDHEISQELERLSGSQFPRDYFNLGHLEIIRAPKCVSKEITPTLEVASLKLPTPNNPVSRESLCATPGPSAKAPATPESDARAATQAARAQAGMSRNAPSRKEVR